MKKEVLNLTKSGKKLPEELTQNGLISLIKSKIVENGRVDSKGINELLISTTLTSSQFHKLIQNTGIPGFIVGTIYVPRDSEIFLANNFVKETFEKQENYFDDISYTKAADLLDIPERHIEEVLVLALEKNLINGKLNRSKQILRFVSPPKVISPSSIGTPFFCQLDNEQHPSTDPAHQCLDCSRMVCGSCYNQALNAGMDDCPYCHGKLMKVQ